MLSSFLPVFLELDLLICCLNYCDWGLVRSEGKRNPRALLAYAMEGGGENAAEIVMITAFHILLHLFVVVDVCALLVLGN